MSPAHRDLYLEVIRARTRICQQMIAMSVVCLVAGIAMIIIGVAHDQSVWFRHGNTEIYAGGFGAVTLAASLLWGVLAYLNRPFLKPLRLPGSAGSQVSNGGSTGIREQHDQDQEALPATTAFVASCPA